MLSQLRKKFILTIMLLVGALLTAVLVVTCIYNYQNLHSGLIDSMKNAIGIDEEEHDPGGLKNQQGSPPPDNPPPDGSGGSPPNPAKPSAPSSPSAPSASSGSSAPSEGSNRRPSNLPKIGSRDDKPDMAYTAILALVYEKDTQEIEIISNSSADIDGSILDDAVQQVINSRSREGFIDEYKLIYYRSSVRSASNDVSVAFANSAYITDRMANYIFALLLIEIIAMVFIYIISRFIATLAIRPIEQVWNEQRRFIADASHELKTPLTVMMANFSIMKANSTERISDHMQWLESSEEESAHMSELINDMLLLAQSESGIKEETSENMNLSAVTTGVVLQFEALAYENNITFTENIDDDIIICGNSGQIRRLVMTLIDNAVKYEPSGGSITVDLKKHHDKAELSVINCLSRIDAEDIPHLFERFYRQRNDSGKNGYGLGLAIARSIAESHGGSVSVQSGEMTGTVFTVILKRVYKNTDR